MSILPIIKKNQQTNMQPYRSLAEKLSFMFQEWYIYDTADPDLYFCSELLQASNAQSIYRIIIKFELAWFKSFCTRFIRETQALLPLSG